MTLTHVAKNILLGMTVLAVGGFTFSSPCFAVKQQIPSSEKVPDVWVVPVTSLSFKEETPEKVLIPEMIEPASGGAESVLPVPEGMEEIKAAESKESKDQGNAPAKAAAEIPKQPLPPVSSPPVFGTLKTESDRLETILSGLEGTEPSEKKTDSSPPSSVAEKPLPLPPASTETPVQQQPEKPVVLVEETLAPVGGNLPTHTIQKAVSDVLVKKLSIESRGPLSSQIVFELDTQKRPELPYALQDGNKSLVISVPVSVWSALREGIGAQGGLVESWRVLEEEEGTLLVLFRLKLPASVTGQTYRAADYGLPALYVFDVSARK